MKPSHFSFSSFHVSRFIKKNEVCWQEKARCEQKVRFVPFMYSGGIKASIHLYIFLLPPTLLQLFSLRKMLSSYFLRSAYFINFSCKFWGMFFAIHLVSYPIYVYCTVQPEVSGKRRKKKKKINIETLFIWYNLSCPIKLSSFIISTSLSWMIP